jgi:exodeoxyribonuclease V alpha subunit
VSVTPEEMTAGAGSPATPEPGDPRFALRSPDALRPFNEVLVLTAADVHVARRLGDLGGERDPAVLLGVALATRALRLGHVLVDLADVARTATTDSDTAVDLSHLPWPDAGSWRDLVAASPLVADGDHGLPDRPLRLIGSRLYLDRYWRQEGQVADYLTARSLLPVTDVDTSLLRDGLARLWPNADPDGPDLQRLAGAAAVLQGFTVVAGGPGTGKTTTVARILALLGEQARAAWDRADQTADAAGNAPSSFTGSGKLRAALAAPTGKAAARLEEAVHAATSDLDVAPEIKAQLDDLHALTVHRLLGRRPDSNTRFRHDRTNHLPHDVVIIDEASMVSLSQMASLVEAIRPTARLILVGDPEQLASVEAGAVLGDIVGPAARGSRIRPETRARLGQATGQPVPASDPPGTTAIGDGIILLRRVHRYGGGIARLARAIQGGDADAAVELLASAGRDINWIDVDPDVQAAQSRALTPVRDQIVTAGRSLVDAAGRGDGRTALRSLAAVRVLCAHRRGPAGIGRWNEHIERWLGEAIAGYGTLGPWYLGRPVLVTTNDYQLQLFNGDTGVVIRGTAGEPVVAFELGNEIIEVNPLTLGDIQTLHAMTVHKSQGSQFASVVVVLPDPSSRVLTRELLYTAITRAEQHLTIVGPEVSIRAAIGRPIARATGLESRLWA